MLNGFKQATLRCITQFLDDDTHRDGKSPFIIGPCDECSAEVVAELRAQGLL